MIQSIMIRRLSSLKQSKIRQYNHLAKNSRRLLVIERNNLECSKREMGNDVRAILFTSMNCGLLVLILIKALGPHQMWYHDKLLNLKFKLYALIGKHKDQVDLDIDKSYIEEIKNSKAAEMMKEREIKPVTRPEDFMSLKYIFKGRELDKDEKDKRFWDCLFEL